MVKRKSKKWSLEGIPQSMIGEFEFTTTLINQPRPKYFFYSSSKTTKALSMIPGQFTFSAHEDYQPTPIALETFHKPIKSKFSYRNTEAAPSKRARKARVNLEAVPKEYQDWKTMIYDYLSNEHSFVTEAYILDLKTVNPGIYSIGTDISCDKRITKGHTGSPTCPDHLGYLFVYGDNQCTLTLNQKDIVVNLIPGTLYNVTLDLKIKVGESKVMAVIDTKRMAYINLLKKNIDMFFPYNPAIVFRGEMISESVLLIKVNGENQEFKPSYFPEGRFYELFYIDLLAQKQNYMQCRVVKLQQQGNEMVVDFNYSYSISTGKHTGIPINEIDWAVEGGINPKYF